MKKLSISVLAAILLSSYAALATPIESDVPVDNLFVPNGFDSNDNSEVIISGYLPNLCYKSPSTKMAIKGNEVKISVKALYSAPANFMCGEMIVPFIQKVSLGLLEKGLYKITVNQNGPGATQEKLKVSESSSDAMDDHLYASVDYVEKMGMGARTVTLKGYNPSDCLELEKIEYIHNGKDTYSILPIMRKIRDFCPMKNVPFAYEFEVPTELKANKVLLHVRSMDGRSVNTIFPNYLVE